MRFLLTTDTVGGVWTFTGQLAEELLRLGHEVCLVSFGRAPSEDQARLACEVTQRYGNRFNYEAETAPLEWMQENAEAYAVGESALLRYAREADVLLTSQFCYGALPLAIPKIVIAHSDVLSWGEAVCEPLDEQSTWLRTYRRLVQDGLDGADRIVAPSRAYLAALARHFVVDYAKTCVIANGRSVKPGAGTRTLQAVSAGRTWDRAKNLVMLEDVQSPMQIVVAGERAGAEEAGCVRHTGAMKEAELMQLFRESAVYVCTSLYEPFGLAPLEAALCGCAVLAMDVLTLREVWGDAAAYFHDAATLQALLQALYEDPDRLHELQQRSSNRAQRYGAAQMAERYLSLCTTLCAQPEVTHAA